jgi:hypothetical protein
MHTSTRQWNKPPFWALAGAVLFGVVEFAALARSRWAARWRSAQKLSRP